MPVFSGSGVTMAVGQPLPTRHRHRFLDICPAGWRSRGPVDCHLSLLQSYRAELTGILQCTQIIKKINILSIVNSFLDEGLATTEQLTLHSGANQSAPVWLR
eukprot:12187456-Ditylum_brightwellii.AAC.1